MWSGLSVHLESIVLNSLISGLIGPMGVQSSGVSGYSIAYIVKFEECFECMLTISLYCTVHINIIPSGFWGLK